MGLIPWTTVMSCGATNILFVVVQAALVMISAVIAALRVYVISGADWRLVVPTLTLGIASIFIYIGITFHGAAFIYASYAEIPYSGCGFSDSVSNAGFYASLSVPFVCSFASDLIVILVTWIRMHKYGDSSGLFSRTSAPRGRLARFLLVDGTVYFVIISLVNIAGLILNFVSVSSGLLMPITVPMSSILTTRSLLNVREAAYTTTINSSISTLSFKHSHGTVQVRVDSELPTITFGDPESALDPEISLQMDGSLPETGEGLPNGTGEWDDADEEDWEGA